MAQKLRNSFPWDNLAKIARGRQSLRVTELGVTDTETPSYVESLISPVHEKRKGQLMNMD